MIKKIAMFFIASSVASSAFALNCSYISDPFGKQIVAMSDSCPYSKACVSYVSCKPDTSSGRTTEDRFLAICKAVNAQCPSANDCVTQSTHGYSAQYDKTYVRKNYEFDRVEVSRLYFDGKRQVSALDSPFEAKGTDYKYIYSSYELFPFLIAPKTRSCLPFCVGEIVLKNGYAVGKNFVSCKAVNYTNSNGSKPNNTAAQVNKIYGPSDTQYNGFYPSYTCPYADDCK